MGNDGELFSIDTLEPIIQAAALLQARKTEDNVQAICDKCNALKVSQIIKLLNSYTPLDETEERVTPAFVRKIQAKLAERAATENSQELLMPQRLSVAIKFPFCPSTTGIRNSFRPYPFICLVRLGDSYFIVIVFTCTCRCHYDIINRPKFKYFIL